MQTIVMTNKKGGVAKTTTALATAASLGMRGKRVLAIDMDSQANFTQSSGGEHGVLGTYDFLKSEDASLADCLQHAEHYDFIGADKRLSTLASDLQNVIGREHILEKALRKVRGYDFAVIDTPPSMEVLTLNALVAADSVVVCCQADTYSVTGLAEMRKNFANVKEYYNPRLRVAGILMTRYNGRTMLAKELSKVFEHAAEAMTAKVFRSVIRENIALKEAAARAQSIFDYQSGSHGAEDYNAFVTELLSGMEKEGERNGKENA